MHKIKKILNGQIDIVLTLNVSEPNRLFLNYFIDMNNR